MNINHKEIIKLFKDSNLEWFVNIYNTKSKDLTYSPLYDEESFDSADNLSTSLVVIKNWKKAIFKLDWFDFESLKKAMSELSSIIDYSTFDKDIVMPEIFDEAVCDFSNLEVKNIWFDFLQNEFLKIKNFNFQKEISIESFSIWTKFSTQTYINSNWSVKTQSDSSSYYYIELLAKNDENSEVDYEYFESNVVPSIDFDKILELQKQLISKIKPNTKTLESWIYTVTLDKKVVWSFLEILLWNLSSEAIREWLSIFSNNKIWDKIFSDKLTLINNPNLPWYTWNVLFDSEWVTAKKTTLIENWVLKSKFYDYKNALKEWLENLWNSWIRNIELVWETTWEYLKWSKFLFTSLMAFHTVDASTWKYSLSGEWYLIHCGKKSSFIKNISLSWDIVSLFSNIKSIWDDFFQDWNFKVPSITFEKQKVI